MVRHAGQIAVFGLCMLGAACREPDADADADSSSAPADDGPVRRLSIDDPSTHWRDAGFVAMVPPVRLPSSAPDVDDVVVWLRIPDGGVIETRELGVDGRLSLVFPPGTTADRVEQRGRGAKRAVVDVRGTTVGEGGEQWMHTLRRARGDRLFGFEWPRSLPEAHAEATARLLAELPRYRPAATMEPAARERYLASIERKNQCTRCHTYDRPDNTRANEHGLVNRGTDGSGFFTPQTVLLDEIVLEGYGGVDRNLDDPWITVRCPDGAPVQHQERGARVRATCEDGLPLARLDLRAALAAGDERAQQTCRARRYLHAHLDARGRERFASALSACDPDG